MLRIALLSMLAGLLGVAATDVSAQGIVYECDITNRPENVDWISPKLMVILPDKGQPQAFDSVSRHFFGKPVAAKASKRGDMLITRWSLKGVRDSNEQAVPQFQFTARINTKTNAVHLEAKPASFPNRWTGRGTCKTRRQ